MLSHVALAILTVTPVVHSSIAPRASNQPCVYDTCPQTADGTFVSGPQAPNFGYVKCMYSSPNGLYACGYNLSTVSLLHVASTSICSDSLLGTKPRVPTRIRVHLLALPHSSRQIVPLGHVNGPEMFDVKLELQQLVMSPLGMCLCVALLDGTKNRRRAEHES